MACVADVVALLPPREVPSGAEEHEVVVLRRHEALIRAARNLEMLGECMQSCTASSGIQAHGNAGRGLLTRVRIEILRSFVVACCLLLLVVCCCLELLYPSFNKYTTLKY